MSMLTRCVRCNRVFRTSTWLLTSVLRVRAIIHRPKGFRRVLPDQRKRFCRVVPRWNTVITRNRQVIVEVSRKKKRDQRKRERKDEFGDWPWTSRPFGPTNRPKDILKTTGRDDVFSFSLFAGPRDSDFAFSFPRMERNDIYNWNILLGWIFLDILVLEQYRLSPRQDQTNFPAFLTRISGNCDVSIDYYIASVTSYSFRNCPIRFAKGERLIEPAITKNRIFMDRLVLKFFNAAVAVPFVFQFNAAFYYRATTRAHPMKNILRVRVLHLTKNKLL